MNIKNAIDAINREAKVLNLTFDETVKKIDALGGSAFSEYLISAMMSYKNKQTEFQPLNGVRK